MGSELDRDETIRRILSEIVQLPLDQRLAYLDDACEGDEVLRDELSAMLSDEDAMIAMVDTANVSLGVVPKDTAFPGKHAPELASDVIQSLGNYQIVRRLGAGGMGTVFEATQANPRRRVALKVISAKMDSDDLRRRFQFETEVLGRLQHPGIAQIYEAQVSDVAEGDRPFFAMELVEGVPITEYAAAENLSVRERLELVVRLCEAIEHAHQKGIVHRDLKPGNILVTSTGQPKVLDFGIARVLESQYDRTVATQTGQVVGTINYMSPEQASGGGIELDARSDVYSVGVVLYELLTKQLPYDLRSRSFIASLAAIQTEEPRRLRAVNPKLRGDVETIVRKTLEKDRDQRYRSAADLSDDIRRYLTDEPILAHPPSVVYQVMKFARRNRVLVGSAITIATLLVISTAVTGWLALAARSAAENERTERVRWQQSQQEAVREAEKARQLVTLFTEMFRAARPRHASGSELTAREMLDGFAKRKIKELANQPENAAILHASIGSAYGALGRNKEAHDHCQQAYNLAVKELGTVNKTTLFCMTEYGSSLARLGRLEAALRIQAQAFPIAKRLHGEDHRVTILTKSRLANVYSSVGRLEEAELLLNESIRQAKTSFADRSGVARLISNLAAVYYRSGRLAEAEPLYREAVQIQIESLGTDHVLTQSDQKNLAVTLVGLGRLEDAVPYFQSNCDMCRRVFGDQNPNTLHAQLDLGRLYFDLGDLAKALPLVETFYTTPGDHRNESYEYFQEIRIMLGSCYLDAKRFADAEQCLTKGYQYYAKRQGPFGPYTQQARELLKQVYDQTDRPELSQAIEPIAPDRPVAEQALSTTSQGTQRTVVATTQPFGNANQSITHVATTWQIRDSNGSYNHRPTLNVVSSDSLTEIAIPASLFDAKAEYWMRVRFAGSNGLASEFSEEVKLVPDAPLEPTVQLAIDLKQHLNRDVVLDEGDQENDPFDSDAFGHLVVEGFDGVRSGNKNVQGLPLDGRLGVFQLASYRTENTIQVSSAEAAPLNVELPGVPVRAVRFLVAGANGESELPARLHFADGETRDVTIACPDWFASKLPYNRNAIHSPYLDGMDRWDNGRFDDANSATLFQVFLPLDDEKPLARVELMAGDARLASSRSRIHVFAMTITVPESVAEPTKDVPGDQADTRN